MTFSDVPDYYAKRFITQASQVGIVRGASATEFKPLANAKRAEAVVMLQRALDLQDSELPEDEVLLSAVLDSEEKENQIYKDKTYEKLEEVQPLFYSGYYLAINQFTTQELLALVEEGYEVGMEKLTDQTLTVLNKTDRFAVIESKGGSYKTSITIDNEHDLETIATDGQYLLKKMQDNSWKIYMYYQDEQQ
ncbi:MAG: S-layer homology domain-containing protein [Candidatus Pristimantibacillus sp.]